MVEPLSVNTDGVRSLGDIHNRVAAALAALSAATPDPIEVAESHGAIAHSVTTALNAALESRSRSMDSARHNAEHLAGLLHRAALAYERGDEGAATAVDSALDTITPSDD